MSNADRAGCRRTQEDRGQGERGVSSKKWTPSCPHQKTAHQEDKKGGGITLCCGKQIKAEKIMSPQEKGEQKVLLMEEGWEKRRLRPLDAEGDLMTVWVGSFKGRVVP